MMETLNFTNNSFVLYQILPNHKKIDFLNESFDKHDAALVADKLYFSHFDEIITPGEDTQIGILSYLSQDGSKINIIFHGNIIHVNSDRMKPIHELVYAIFNDGNIIYQDKSLKKNKYNRERFHMKYYRAYRKLNILDGAYPISLS